MRINEVLYMTENTVHFLPALSQPEEEVKKVIELFKQFLDTVAKH